MVAAVTPLPPPPSLPRPSPLAAPLAPAPSGSDSAPQSFPLPPTPPVADTGTPTYGLELPAVPLLWVGAEERGSADNRERGGWATHHRACNGKAAHGYYCTFTTSQQSGGGGGRSTGRKVPYLQIGRTPDWSRAKYNRSAQTFHIHRTQQPRTHVS